MLKKLKTSEVYVGVDEAGRGALAGPVVAAAVYIRRHVSFIQKIRDSKKLSKSLRQQLYRELLDSPHTVCGIGSATSQEIDEVNILQATYRAMHRAIDGLGMSPAHLYIDGNRFYTYKNTPHTCVIGGDDIYCSIAAASILAKVHRDQLMSEMATQYPDYGLEQHKGYGTLAHRKAISEHGYSPIHRKSFTLK